MMITVLLHHLYEEPTLLIESNDIKKSLLTLIELFRERKSDEKSSSHLISSHNITVLERCDQFFIYHRLYEHSSSTKKLRRRLNLPVGRTNAVLDLKLQPQVFSYKTAACLSCCLVKRSPQRNRKGVSERERGADNEVRITHTNAH